VSDFSSYRGIVGKTASSIPGPFDFYLNQTTGVPTALFGNGSSYSAIQGTTAPPLGVWQHLAVVKSGSSVTIYLNGQPDGTGSVSAPEATPAGRCASARAPTASP